MSNTDLIEKVRQQNPSMIFARDAIRKQDPELFSNKNERILAIIIAEIKDTIENAIAN